MTRFRRVFVAFATVFVFASVGVAMPNYSSVSCLWASAGCGQGTNKCGYDCPFNSMTCMKHSSPLEFCKCENGECQTVECDDPGDA